MLKVTKVNNRRVDIELSGKLDKESMQSSLNALIEACEGVENGVMLYTIKDFELPTLGAIGVEFSMLPQLFKLFGAFDRAAVLTEKDWIQSVSEWEGKLIPGLDIKAFDLDEREQAEAWLQGV